MIKLSMIKSGVQILASIGVGVLVDEGLKKLKPPNLSGVKKTAVRIGGFVVSSMAVDKATDYIEDKWNETEEMVRDLINPKEEKEQTEEEAE